MHIKLSNDKIKGAPAIYVILIPQIFQQPRKYTFIIILPPENFLHKIKVL